VNLKNSAEEHKGKFAPLESEVKRVKTELQESRDVNLQRACCHLWVDRENSRYQCEASAVNFRRR